MRRIKIAGGRALARTLKLPIILERVPAQNGLKLYKMVQSGQFLPVKNKSYPSKWRAWLVLVLAKVLAWGTVNPLHAHGWPATHLRYTFYNMSSLVSILCEMIISLFGNNFFYRFFRDASNSNLWVVMLNTTYRGFSRRGTHPVRAPSRAPCWIFLEQQNMLKFCIYFIWEDQTYGMWTYLHYCSYGVIRLYEV